MTVKLYKCYDSKNKLNKTLTDEFSLTGNFRNNFSLSDIQLVLNFDNIELFDYNYVYIELLHRYYFVDDCKILSNNRIELALSIDVLMTYKTDIENMRVKLSKSNIIFDDSDCNVSDSKKLVNHYELQNVFSEKPYIYMTCVNGDTTNE